MPEGGPYYFNAHFGLIGLGVVCSYFPLYLGLQLVHDDDAELYEVIHSVSYLDPAKMAVAISFPMLMNSLLDIRDIQLETIHRHFLQWSYIVALLLPNSLLLHPGYSGTEIYVCSASARGSIFYGAINAMIALRSDSIPWKKFLLLHSAISLVLINLYSWWNFVGFSVTSQNALSGLSGAAMACSIALTFRFMYYYVTTIKTQSNFQTLIAQCIAIFMTNCLIRWTVYAITGTFESFTFHRKQLAVSFLWLDIVTYVIAHGLNSRFLRAETAILQEKLKQNKSFVAHISHEIRTPLNSISLGLQMLFKRILGEGNGERGPLLLRESYDDLCCLDIATQTALQTLNEILTFDKLESRSVTLEMQPIRVLDLIRMAAKAFKLQVSNLMTSGSIIIYLYLSI